MLGRSSVCSFVYSVGIWLVFCALVVVSCVHVRSCCHCTHTLPCTHLHVHIHTFAVVVVNRMYPVWYTDRLDVKESVRRGLVSRLVQFSVERNDVQENGVVHDIVDPDLAPHRLPAYVCVRVCMCVHVYVCS